MFITGAGSGMGQLTAKRALADGWKVAAVDLNMEGLKNLGEHDNLLCIELDITDADQVANALERAEAELGPIFRLVNAAGIMPLGILSDMQGNLVKRITEINYFGFVNQISVLLPKMIERGQGEIVSYASMAGHWPMYYMGAYNASKAAVTSYTEVLHHENKRHGIRIVCVCPPVVSTPLLKQADDTIRPKMFDLLPPITSEMVLDKIDKVLRGRGLWVFPGPFTRFSWWGRRFLPGFMWAFLKRLESF